MLATVIRLALPLDESSVAVVLKIEDDSGLKNHLTIPAHILKQLASMDRVPQVGDSFELNMWRVQK